MCANNTNIGNELRRFTLNPRIPHPGQANPAHDARGAGKLPRQGSRHPARQADHSEFRGYVFALLFYKRISDCFDEEVRIQADMLIKAGLPQEQALALARDPQNHHFIVPEAAAWNTVASTAKGQLGQALNDAMLAIERANAHRQNNFDGILTGKIDFNKQDELPRDKLVNLINHFGSQTFDRAHVSDDLFGNAYEYLIRNFASKAGKSSGEFYTPPKSVF